MKKDQYIKGVLHVHSDLSHDGSLGLEELKSFFISKGFNFLCLTDHSQDVSVERFQELKKELRRLSDDCFVFIPGIEYSCDHGVHIMGIGIEDITGETEHGKVIDHIHNSGGIAVWAHPMTSKYADKLPSWISRLDGMEIWNLRGDGKFLPQAKTIAAYYKFKKINPGLLAFFGMDFHNIETYYNLSLKLGTACDETSIFNALKHGKYICTSSTLSLTSEPELGILTRLLMAAIKAILNFLKRARNRIIGAQR